MPKAREGCTRLGDGSLPDVDDVALIPWGTALIMRLARKNSIPSDRDRTLYDSLSGLIAITDAS